MTRKKGNPCPVCNRPFENLGGLNAHLKLAKDAKHAAHREGLPPGSTPTPTPTVTPAPKEGGKDPAPAAPATVTPAPPPPQQEEKATPQATLMVTFEGPPSVQPLVPPTPPVGGTPADPAKAALEVKDKAAEKAKAHALDHIRLGAAVNDGVAVICNGFFLRGDGDDQMTPSEVEDTGFGDSVEYAVRKYFPDLPLDHPLVILGVATASLATVVAAKKAKKPKDQLPEPPKALPAPREPPVPSQQAQEVPVPEPASEAEAQSQAYWSNIQQQAGGPPAVGA